VQVLAEVPDDQRFMAEGQMIRSLAAIGKLLSTFPSVALRVPLLALGRRRHRVLLSGVMAGNAERPRAAA